MENNRSQEQIIADNLVAYRKAANLTQLEIAEKFNYSDKSISKWERAEGLPDIIVLKQLADFYGIKVDDFFLDEPTEIKIKKVHKHAIIACLAIALLWTVVIASFVGLRIALPNVFAGWWLLLVYAVVGSSIIAIIFSALFNYKLIELIASSVCIWSATTALFLSLFLFLSIENKAFICFTFLIGVPFQILVILWYYLKKTIKSK